LLGVGEVGAAEGRAVMVYVDNTDPARPSTPLPDVVRRAAEAVRG
jgi:acyl-CoA thioester hydrolase